MSHNITIGELGSMLADEIMKNINISPEPTDEIIKSLRIGLSRT